MLTGALVLAGLFVVGFVSGGSHFQDPLFCVFAVFSFTSVVDLIISLEEDGYISGFVEVYVREGEPYLRTAHGIMICYWDGIVHYALYLAMITAMSQRKSYRNLGLFWLGSLMMSIVVFLLGNLIGKYSSDISPAFLLNMPYVLILIWAGLRLFQQPKALPCLTADKIAEEQHKGLHQRPQDLGLVLFLILAAAFTFFRGLVVLDCPADSCFENRLERVARYRSIDRTRGVHGAGGQGWEMQKCPAKPGRAVLALGHPCHELPCALQAQFSHLGSSLHARTPFPYQTPEDAWWSFLLTNVLYALGPQLLAYRCLRCPAFFLPAAPASLDKGKKRQ
nr:PREDICTED: transmembrane 6 superfamily member 2 [Apteryx mantelli mantelli]